MVKSLARGCPEAGERDSSPQQADTTVLSPVQY